MSEAGRPERIATFSALRHGEFRFFFASLITANLGIWMQQFALGWLVVELAVREGDPSLAGFYLGLRSLAAAIPSLALGLLAGVLADRVDRRDLLLRARLAAAAVAIVLALLVITGTINMVIVIAFSVLASAVFAFDPPGRLAIVPSIVPLRDLFSAMGLTRASMQLAHALGPLIGGLLIVPIGVGGVLLAKAGLTLASVATLIPIRPRPPVREQEPSVAGALMEGLGHIRRDELLRAVVLLQIVFALMSQAVQGLLPAVAVETLGAGAMELSWLTAAMGAGSIVGAFAIGSIGNVERRGRLLLATMLACGLLTVVFGLQRTLLGAIGMLVALGLVQQLFMGLHTVILQLGAPDHLRGRVMGSQWIVFMTFGPIGVLAVGTLGTLIGVSNALVLAGAAAGAGGVLVSVGDGVIRELRGGAAGAVVPVPAIDGSAAE